MANPGIFLREDQAIIQAQVSGINLPAVYSWTSLEGGVLEAASVFTRPGGMLPGKQLGGPSERSDVTVRRQFTPDLQAYVVTLENRVGKSSVVVSYTPLDDDGAVAAKTIIMTGILKQVARTNFDANNSASAFLGLVVALDQEASING